MMTHGGAEVVVDLLLQQMIAEDRRGRLFADCLGAMVLLLAICWMVVFGWWMFCGTGFAEVTPAAYNAACRLLMATPATNTRAAELIETKGYISLMDARALVRQTPGPRFF